MCVNKKEENRASTMDISCTKWLVECFWSNMTSVVSDNPMRSANFNSPQTVHCSNVALKTSYSWRPTKKKKRKKTQFHFIAEIPESQNIDDSSKKPLHTCDIEEDFWLTNFRWKKLGFFCCQTQYMSNTMRRKKKFRNFDFTPKLQSAPSSIHCEKSYFGGDPQETRHWFWNQINLLVLFFFWHSPNEFRLIFGTFFVYFAKNLWRRKFKFTWNDFVGNNFIWVVVQCLLCDWVNGSDNKLSFYFLFADQTRKWHRIG